MNTVPIPPRMAQLPRDPRGYPVPVTVLIDSSGRPQFTINDEEKRQKLLAEDRCPICGTRIIGGRWFVGGPLAAFHDHGAYIDPPMHDECAHYALQVCPYLAAPVYSGRIDARKLSADDRGSVYLDPTMLPERPELFVAVLAHTTISHRNRLGLVQNVAPSRPYMRVEFWRHGERLDDADGQASAAAALQRPIQPQPPRLVRSK